MDNQDVIATVEPAQGGSISGSMHRAWTNIKSTISGKRKATIRSYLVLSRRNSGW